MNLLHIILTQKPIPKILREYPAWFFGILAICLFHRLFAIVFYATSTFRSTYAPSSVSEALQLWMDIFFKSTILGIAYDILFSALIALPVVLAPKFLRFIFLLVLSGFLSANIEHIRFNSEHIVLSTLGLGLDMTFIRGMLNLNIIAFTFVLLMLGSSIVTLFQAKFRSSLLGAACLVGVFSALVLPSEGSFANPLWLQSNPFLGTPLKSTAVNVDRNFASGAFVPKLIDTDALQEKNVLLVYMEGLSARSLEMGDMHYLAELSKQNVNFERYVGTQLITANGLYSSLTGSLPYLARRGLKWEDGTKNLHTLEGVLPIYLRQRGYQTAFLESAPLGYMSKDEILPQFGFEQVLGRESWDRYYSADMWGIDDRALFEHTIDYIETFSSDAPWFVSVLTTGTHAPYNVPANYLADEPSSRYRALRYLDEAVEGLIQSLRARGLLENTIVVFTSDESRARSVSGQLQNQLALNWLPLIVMHPSGVQASVRTYTSATQLPDLIANLQTDDVALFVSNLKTDIYPLVFGNVYSKRLFWYDPAEQILLACVTSSFVCAEYNNVPDAFSMPDSEPNSVQSYPRLRAIVEELDYGR